MKREPNKGRSLRSQEGFTLIEMIIVLAIIGVLAAVAIPNYLRGRDRAKFMGCVEALTDVKMAQEIFVSENDVYATTFDELAMHMIPGCSAADGSDCAGEVEARIGNNCTVPTMTLIAGGGSYRIEAESKDRFGCKICVNTKGYRPERLDPAQCAVSTCP